MELCYYECTSAMQWIAETWPEDMAGFLGLLPNTVEGLDAHASVSRRDTGELACSTEDKSQKKVTYKSNARGNAASFKLYPCADSEPGSQQALMQLKPKWSLGTSRGLGEVMSGEYSCYNHS